jgi:hypothetical protein
MFRVTVIIDVERFDIIFTWKNCCIIRGKKPAGSSIIMAEWDGRIIECYNIPGGFRWKGKRKKL